MTTSCFYKSENETTKQKSFNLLKKNHSMRYLTILNQFHGINVEVKKQWEGQEKYVLNKTKTLNLKFVYFSQML